MPPSHQCKIWIGGLPSEAEAEDIEDICKRYGRVMDVNIRNSPRDRFAFVEFDNDRDAMDAIKGLDQTKLKGRAIKVSTANPAGQRPAGGRFNDRGPPPGRGGRRNSRDPPPRRGRSNSRRRGPPPRALSRSPSRRRQRARSDSRRSRSRGAGGAARGYKLKLNGVPDDMTSEELQEIVEPFGRSIMDCRVFNERGDVTAEIVFEKVEDAKSAFRELDDRKISGHGKVKCTKLWD
mmetsp:Transcript_2828/g.6426  ORF Transcript_2828/g.6426 Transcript_2828/m.6426 type:complete len:235 (+) Transcript_2828:66-770(+)